MRLASRSLGLPTEPKDWLHVRQPRRADDMINRADMADQDVVIVGGGPAGVSAALFFAALCPARKSRLLLLEKERYPRDKYCAGGLGGRADRALAAVGVRVDVPSVEVHGISCAFKGGATIVRERAIGRVVRRIEFDHALALAARARGVTIREGVRVTGVTWGEGGASVETSEGTIRARVVVGADGVGSVVRRAMGVPFGRVRAQVIEVDTEGAPGDAPRDVLHFDLRDRAFPGYSWDFPTLVGGEELVCRGTYVLQGEGSPDPEDVLRARMAAIGLDLGRYRLKRFAERGFEPGRGVSRPNAILIGEAAGIDPMLGEGIAQAIDYGALAGRYLADKLAAGDLRMADWSLVIRSSRMGKDLRARAALVPRFFGPMRDPVERYVLGVPAFLEAGMQYFGGKAVSRAALARAAAACAVHGARLGLERLARAAKAMRPTRATRPTRPTRATRPTRPTRDTRARSS
jgi:flavin-dependent dehydrogenase